MKRKSIPFWNSSDSEKGAVMVIFAGTLIGLIAILAVAVDSGKAFRTRLIIQSSADAAALAGARIIAQTLPGDNRTDEAREAARQVLISNLLANGFEGSEIEAFTGASSRFEINIDDDDPAPAPIRFSLAVNEVNVDSILFRLIPGFQRVISVGATVDVAVRSANVHVLVDTSNSMLCPPNADPDQICGCGRETNFGDGVTVPCTVENSKMQVVIDALVGTAANPDSGFLDFFDVNRDRIGITAFSTGAGILRAINDIDTPGFNKGDLETAIRNIPVADAIDLPPAPIGLTNTCDALVQARNDMVAKSLEENAVYVIFTDGSPTAGRFNFVTPLAGALNSNDHYFWDEAAFVSVDGDGDPDTNPDVIDAAIPSKLAEADPNDPDLFFDFVPGPDSAPRVPACSDLEFRDVVRDNNAEDRLENCMDNVSFSTSGATFDGLQKFPLPGVDANGDPQPGNPFDWKDDFYNRDPANPDVNPSQRFREMFYDCALAWADTIRAEGGTVFVVAVGPEAEQLGDPYQDISAPFKRKDYFLNRMAFDPCGSQDPDFAGFDTYQELSLAGRRPGLSLVTEPVDRDVLATQLNEYFRIIAGKIKTLLAG